MSLPASMSVPTLRVRYFAFNCLEMKFPTGKTLVVDPCLFKEGHLGCGYDVNDLEGCDYVFLNHSHGDHAASLGELYDRFHPQIMAHAATSYYLAKFYDIPYVRFLPFTFNDELDFDDFKLQVVAGRHNNWVPGNFMVRPSGRRDELCPPAGEGMGPPPARDELEQLLGDLGTAYGSNFLLTTANNLRVGFFAGNTGFSDPQDRNLWRQLRPDVIFAHRAKLGTFDAAECAEQMAAVLEVTGARILVPIHMEDAYSGKYDPEDYVNAVNACCAEKGVLGRCLFMERGQWYQFATCAAKL